MDVAERVRRINLGCWCGLEGQPRQQKVLRLVLTFATDPIAVSRALPGLMRGEQCLKPVDLPGKGMRRVHLPG